MEITINHPDTPLPTRYAHSLSMTIRSFKGHQDVEVHLFRGSWDDSLENGIDWTDLLSSDTAEGTQKGRTIILESFSAEERDRIINYLKRQYSTRVTAIRSTPLTFPVPKGLSGLSESIPNENIGIIDFEKIPSYTLDLPLKGLYDLSRHPPIMRA